MRVNSHFTTFLPVANAQKFKYFYNNFCWVNSVEILGYVPEVGWDIYNWVFSKDTYRILFWPSWFSFLYFILQYVTADFSFLVNQLQ